MLAGTSGDGAIGDNSKSQTLLRMLAGTSGGGATVDNSHVRMLAGASGGGAIVDNSHVRMLPGLPIVDNSHVRMRGARSAGTDRVGIGAWSSRRGRECQAATQVSAKGD